MPNDTDTDVLDSTSADSVLAGGGADKSSDVLAGGGADPGADISMQDVSGTTPMTSPLGGQQPGQLPPMIGQPPAGGVGPGTQQAPVGAGIHARHGGLLTGLAGVLLDGIAAGIMTPQSGQGFAESAQRAYGMPMERQKNAALMESYKTQQELDKANTAMAHVKTLQAYALATKLSDEKLAELTDEQVKDHEQWQEEGAVDQIGSAPTREEAFQQVHQMRVQDPDQGDQYWMWPTGHDGQGNVTGWGVYKMNPNKPIGKEQTLLFPSIDPETRTLTMKPLKLDPKTTVGVANYLHSESFLQRVMQETSKPDKTLTDVGIAFDPVSKELRQTTRAEAETTGMQDFSKATETQLGAYRTRQGQLNDVQMNTSRFLRAANQYATNPPSRTFLATDEVNLNGLLNKAGVAQLDLKIGKDGEIDIPGLSATLEALSREARSTQYGALSPQAKELLDGYQRTLASMPAYMRALAQTGRFTEQQMNLEMQQLPNPTMSPRDIARKINQFNENIRRAETAIPRMLGMDRTTDIRRQYETGGTWYTGSSPEEPLTPLPTGANQPQPTGAGGAQAPVYGHQKSTGKPVVSTDGGKTWRLAQP